MSGAAIAPWDLTPVARAVLEDYDSPPYLVIAAWQYLYGWKPELMTGLVAAGRADAKDNT